VTDALGLSARMRSTRVWASMVEWEPSVRALEFTCRMFIVVPFD